MPEPKESKTLQELPYFYGKDGSRAAVWFIANNLAPVRSYAVRHATLNPAYQLPRYALDYAFDSAWKGSIWNKHVACTIADSMVTQYFNLPLDAFPIEYLPKFRQYAALCLSIPCSILNSVGLFHMQYLNAYNYGGNAFKWKSADPGRRMSPSGVVPFVLHFGGDLDDNGKPFEDGSHCGGAGSYRGLECGPLFESDLDELTNEFGEQLYKTYIGPCPGAINVSANAGAGEMAHEIGHALFQVLRRLHFPSTKFKAATEDLIAFTPELYFGADCMQKYADHVELNKYTEITLSCLEEEPFKSLRTAFPYKDLARLFWGNPEDKEELGTIKKPVFELTVFDEDEFGVKPGHFWDPIDYGDKVAPYDAENNKSERFSQLFRFAIARRMPYWRFVCDNPEAGNKVDLGWGPIRPEKVKYDFLVKLMSFAGRAPKRLLPTAGVKGKNDAFATCGSPAMFLWIESRANILRMGWADRSFAVRPAVQALHAASVEEIVDDIKACSVLSEEEGGWSYANVVCRRAEDDTRLFEFIVSMSPKGFPNSAHWVPSVAAKIEGFESVDDYSSLKLKLSVLKPPVSAASLKGGVRAFKLLSYREHVYLFMDFGGDLWLRRTRVGDGGHCKAVGWRKLLTDVAHFDVDVSLGRVLLLVAFSNGDLRLTGCPLSPKIDQKPGIAEEFSWVLEGKGQAIPSAMEDVSAVQIDANDYGQFAMLLRGSHGDGTEVLVGYTEHYLWNPPIVSVGNFPSIDGISGTESVAVGAFSILAFWKSASTGGVKCREGYMHYDLLAREGFGGLGSEDEVTWRKDVYSVLPVGSYSTALDYSVAKLPSSPYEDLEKERAAGALVCATCDFGPTTIVYREMSDGRRAYEVVEPRQGQR